MTVAASNQHRSVELCVGAGGLALGVARAGFQSIAVVDSDKQSCETLRLNKRNGIDHARDWEILEQDIADLDFSKYADVDLVSGGPPCQPFSQGGKRDGRSDERDMLPHFIRAVRECQPRTFLVENVKGLLHASFVNYFNYVIHQLRFPDVVRKHGEKWTEHRARLERLYTGGKFTGVRYNVIWQVLNSANFGVGQRRERVFVVGVRADLGIEYSFPVQTHSREALWADQWVSGDYWERHRIPKTRRPKAPEAVARMLLQASDNKSLQPWRTVRDVIGDLPKIALGSTSRKVSNHFLNPGARTYKGHEGSSMDVPAKTIKAGHHGVSGGENVIRLDDGAVRYFSVRECARLQAFPDDWTFDGAWCNCMRQIGNAVPVALGELVASPLARVLSQK